MLNRIARDAFEDHLKKAVAMPSNHGLGAEHELGLACGLVSYAVFCEDITLKEAELLHLRIRSARAARVASLCREVGRWAPCPVNAGP